MLRNLIEVLKLLNGARPSASSAGLELLLAARGVSEDGAFPAQAAQQALPRKATAQQYVRREADAAWDCMQARGACLGFLLPLLHAGTRVASLPLLLVSRCARLICP